MPQQHRVAWINLVAFHDRECDKIKDAMYVNLYPLYQFGWFHH
jgi:hypothetical protein